METPTQAKPLLYTHPECEYSEILKQELDAAGTAYDEVDLSLHPERWNEVVRLSGGERITPVLVRVDGEVEVGYHGIG